VRGLPAGTRAVLLDVEGTAGDVRFVANVLFPYARARIAAYVARRGASEEIARIARETSNAAAVAESDEAAIVRALEGWSDANAKVKPLKDLQGLIWQEGYADGSLRAPLYDDVPSAIRAWRARGIAVAIYSSGSVLAQRLYFRHSTAGDLTGEIEAYFDTAVGAKGDAASYARIAGAIGVERGSLVFFTDARSEVAAARAAGVVAVRIDREQAPRASGIDPEGNEWWGSVETG
jgi:enolase-phosphatase E1